MDALLAPTVTRVLDALPSAVVVVDDDGLVRGWNRAAEVLYGHRPSEVVGAPVLDVLFDPDDRESAAAVLAGAAEGRRWDGDHRILRSDGVLLVSSFRAVPLGAGRAVAWVATDGMDQGLAEQERAVLLSAEHAARTTAEEALGLVEAIIASAPVGIAVFGLDLRYTRVNDAYADLSGTPAEDHVGGRIDAVLSLPAQVGADLRRVVTTGRTIIGRAIELADRRRPGERRHFTVSYFPVRSTAGALVGAGATVVDVTDARRAEAERAALLHRAEVAQERLAILATASTVLTTTMELDELLDRLAQVLAPTAADWCVIGLIDPTGVVEQVAVSSHDVAQAGRLARVLRDRQVDRGAEGVVADVVRTGQARLVGPELAVEVLRHGTGDGSQPGALEVPSLRAAAVVPIEAHGQVLGVLGLATEGDRTLDEDDLDLAVEVAHRAALAVGNARAFQQEHQIAESLQRALLPATVPQVAGMDVAVRYLAATDGASVGGDWYDVLAFEGGKVALVVGDVVGHDIAASTSMGQVRSALRACACEEPDNPRAAMARVDRLFTPLELSYATCVLAVLDPATGDLRWSNAGHPPPLLVRDGDATFLEDGLGVLLGVTEGAGAREGTATLRPGDLLVLYSDGLVERRGESLADGLARLAASAAGLEVEDPEAVCDALLADLVPPALLRGDDVALLAVRVRAEEPASAGHRLELGADLGGAATARGFVAGVLEAAGWHEAADTATLLVSELVTNALRHGTQPYALVVHVEHDVVEVGVEDGARAVPTPRELDELAEGGRGLLLVGALAAGWGIRSLPGGKVTWFTLRRGATA